MKSIRKRQRKERRIVEEGRGTKRQSSDVKRFNQVGIGSGGHIGLISIKLHFTNQLYFYYLKFMF